jgi:hypothetical protein
LKTRLRDRLLGKARVLAGNTGETVGELLGEAFEVGAEIEHDGRALINYAAKRLASVHDRLDDKLADVATSASHAEAQGAGSLGLTLISARDKLTEARGRAVRVILPVSVAVLAGSGIVLTGIVLARRRGSKTPSES